MSPQRFRLLLSVLMYQLILGNQLHAQELDETNFIRYTRLQGLSNNFISGIVQDAQGYIWIATHKGLNRFDGKYFQSIFKSSSRSPLPDNQIQSYIPAAAMKSSGQHVLVLLRLIRKMASSGSLLYPAIPSFIFGPTIFLISVKTNWAILLCPQKPGSIFLILPEN